jgi:hypothetical protein
LPLEKGSAVGFLTDVLVVLGFVAFMLLCSAYVALTDRMVSGR